MDVWGINTGRGSAEGRNQEPAALAVKIQHEISSFVDTLKVKLAVGSYKLALRK